MPIVHRNQRLAKLHPGVMHPEAIAIPIRPEHFRFWILQAGEWRVL